MKSKSKRMGAAAMTAAAMELARQGLGVNKIGRALGVSHRTARRLVTKSVRVRVRVRVAEERAACRAAACHPLEACGPACVYFDRTPQCVAAVGGGGGAHPLGLCGASDCVFCRHGVCGAPCAKCRKNERARAARSARRAK